MSISDLLVKINDRQLARVTFGGESWLVIKSVGFIRYFNEGDVGDTVPLTYSNINAEYELL